MKAKYYAIILGSFAALIAGCGPTITNLTPQKVPENASGIYTLSMVVRNVDGAIAEQTFDPKIVIDGSERPMQPSDLGNSVYEYDFSMPAGRSEARYYYILDYSREGGSSRTDVSQLYDLALTNRYVLTMESFRGPVGAEIPVVGRGFTEFDRVVIGGFEAETRYQSPQSLVFTVPPLAANQSYRAELIGGYGAQDLGEFHVDGAKMTVVPNPIELTVGERLTLGFSIPYPAPPNGQPISVTTDVPRAIVMPEVAIAPGARTVSVPIQGGSAGSGFLYVSAPGFDEITVPVRVTGTGGGNTNAPSPVSRSYFQSFNQPQGSTGLEEREVIFEEANDDMILGEAEIIEIR